MLPVDKLPGNGPLVQFADGTQRPIKERIICALTLVSVEGEEFFAPNTELLILRSADGNQILLGRDLIERFRLQINGIDSVTIKGSMMYCKTREKLSHPGLAERLFYLKTTIPRRHLETMLSFVIQEDDDNNQFEIIPRESETVGEQVNDPIKVAIGDPDELAPWGRLHIRIPWKGNARPGLGQQAVWKKVQVFVRNGRAKTCR